MSIERNIVASPYNLKKKRSTMRVTIITILPGKIDLTQEEDIDYQYYSFYIILLYTINTCMV